MALVVAMHANEAIAQARYDDHAIGDRVFIAMGGLSTPNFKSQVRVNPRGVGIGTIIDLEKNLKVEKSVTVLSLEGYYRFNRAHRFEWGYFDQERTGDTVIVDSPIQIGDVIFPVDYRVASRYQFKVLKASYAWSFINTSKYEFFLGGGINLRDLSLRFEGQGTAGGNPNVRRFSDSSKLPLPTATAGMTYNVNDKLGLRFRTESFFIEVGGSSGRWQDTSALVDYRIGEKIGIGGGINFFNINLETDLSDDHNAQTQSSYSGLLLYISASF